jgi:hypothetical protein
MDLEVANSGKVNRRNSRTSYWKIKEFSNFHGRPSRGPFGVDDAGRDHHRLDEAPSGRPAKGPEPSVGKEWIALRNTQPENAIEVGHDNKSCAITAGLFSGADSNAFFLANHARLATI